MHDGTGCSAHRRTHGTAAVVDEPVTRVQHPAAPALLQPSLASDVRLVGLAVDRAVELEGRVAAEEEAVEVGRHEPRGGEHVGVEHGLALEPGEQLHELGGLERAALVRLGLGHGGLLVDARCDRDGLDARAAQGREAGGRGGGEVQAHPADATHLCEPSHSNGPELHSPRRLEGLTGLRGQRSAAWIEKRSGGEEHCG